MGTKRRRDIPWNEIETDYITTEASYSDLADKYGVNICMVKRHGKDGGWVEKRSQYAADKAQKIEESRQKESVEQGLAAIREIGNVATASVQYIQAQIKGAGNGTQAEAAVGALRTLLLIIRDCYGILTATEQARVDLDREKLEFEKTKAARTVPAENADRIIIGSEVYGV